jgi:hypothetical protein
MRVEREIIDALGGHDAIAVRVAAFGRAVEDHRFTVGEPAPAEHPLIEAIVRGGGMGTVQIIEQDQAAATTPFIAPIDFRRRFTLQERASITLAASRAMDAGDAVLQVWIDDLNSARDVCTDHVEITSGMVELVRRGLLTADRAAEILAPTPLPSPLLP